MSKKKVTNDNLARRMKEFYEQVPKTRLMRRCPVVIRIDGKAFHTYTRGFCRPFDEVLIRTMQETTKYLCENIMGCVLGYTQSDEISLVLIDYKRLNSSAWFDYEVQKMCSVAASMATMEFNRKFKDNVEEWFISDEIKEEIDPDILEQLYELQEAYIRAEDRGAMFDARVFSIPKEEVTNYIYWRQLDASRNSIQMVGQANFSHNQLQNKFCNDIQDMLLKQKGINWNDFPVYQKRGSCVVKEKYFEKSSKGTYVEYPEGCIDPYEDEEIENGVWRSRWMIDKDIPIFKGDGREYIEKLIYVGEE